MSLGYRLLCAAIGGFLVTASFTLVSEGGAQPNDATPPAETKQEQDASPPPPVVQQQFPDSNYYAPRCDRPKDHEEADLCEQRRMAKAAEDAVWWSAFQTKLGIAGFVAVILSLAFAGWAAMAAAIAARGTIDAARAARDSVDLARHQIALAHRPKIRVRKVRIHSTAAGKPIVVEAEIVNVGDGKADVYFIEYRVDHHGGGGSRSGSGTLPIAGGDIRLMFLLSAGAGRVVSIPTDLMWHGQFEGAQRAFVVSGQVAYKDTFTGKSYDLDGRSNFQPVERRTAFQRFCRWSDTNGLRFVKTDESDPEYEYED